MNRRRLDRIRQTIPNIALAICFIIICSLFFAEVSKAFTAQEIDASVDAALERFKNDIKGGKEFLQSAKGVLVFSRVYKAGFILGGEYGEGALRINDKTVDYYNTAAGSIGFQLGVQAKTIILVFMQEQALDDFRASSGWKIGIDGSVALITVGAGDAVDTTNVKDPIVGFVFDNKGLMFNINLEGAKITKIKK